MVIPWSSLLYAQFVWSMPRSKEKDISRNTWILHNLPQFIISCLLTLQMLHTKIGWYWRSTSSSWEEDVKARPTMDDAQRTTMYANHCNRLPVWLRWPNKVFWNYNINWNIFKFLLTSCLLNQWVFKVIFISDAY